MIKLLVLTVAAVAAITGHPTTTSKHTTMTPQHTTMVPPCRRDADCRPYCHETTATNKFPVCMPFQHINCICEELYMRCTDDADCQGFPCIAWNPACGRYVDHGNNNDHCECQP